MTGRSWPVFGHVGSQGWDHVHAREMIVRMHAERPPRPVVPLTAVEDPDGPYLAWVGVEAPERLAMVMREHIFEIQFPGGSQDKVQKGLGEVVRVRIDRREDIG